MITLLLTMCIIMPQSDTRCDQGMSFAAYPLDSSNIVDQRADVGVWGARLGAVIGGAELTWRRG